MDAVELNYPVDVVAPKLMGSEGFAGGCGAGVEVTVKASEDCKSEHVSVVGKSSSLAKCNSFLTPKGVFFTSISYLEQFCFGVWLFSARLHLFYFPGIATLLL